MTHGKRIHVVTVRLDDDELDALDVVAERLGRGRSWVVRRALAVVLRGSPEHVYEILHRIAQGDPVPLEAMHVLESPAPARLHVVGRDTSDVMLARALEVLEGVDLGWAQSPDQIVALAVARAGCRDDVDRFVAGQASRGERADREVEMIATIAYFDAWLWHCRVRGAA